MSNENKNIYVNSKLKASKCKLCDMFQLLRPKQWLKNSFVFASLIFAVRFTHFNEIFLTFSAAICFCLISSAVYIFNDIVDVERDLLHPTKKNRPIASGRVSKIEAIFMICVLLPIASGYAYFIGIKFLLVILAYLLNNVLYTFYLKNMVILDVMSIAGGFLFRVVAGAFAINVIISPWILLCTLLLALFLGFSKRRGEIVLLEINAAGHRKILSEYSLQFIDNMLSIVTASIVMAYSLYTFETGKHNLMATIPFVLYGVFRYQYVLYVKKEGGSPEETVISDKPLLIDVILWVILSGIILLTGK